MSPPGPKHTNLPHMRRERESLDAGEPSARAKPTILGWYRVYGLFGATGRCLQEDFTVDCAHPNLCFMPEDSALHFPQRKP